jgi:hypothetical protein
MIAAQISSKMMDALGCDYLVRPEPAHRPAVLSSQCIDPADWGTSYQLPSWGRRPIVECLRPRTPVPPGTPVRMQADNG